MNSILLTNWKSWLLLSLGFLTSAALLAQDLSLTIPHETVQQGEIVEVEITTANFDDMVSLQFSINWNPTVIDFLNFTEKDLTNVAIGTADSDNGTLRFSWFDVEGIGESIDDNKIVTMLQFAAIGQVGESTALEVTGSPLEIQVFQDTGVDTIFQAINLDVVDGSVTIVSPQTGSEISIVGTISDVNCLGTNDGAIALDLTGTGNYTFDWQGPDNFSSIEQNIQDLTGGDYTLAILNEDGLTVLDTFFTINQPLQALAITAIQTDTTDCDKPNGAANIIVAGGTAPYTYDIGFGAINQSMMAGLNAGNYSLTIADANACTLITDFNVPSPSGFTLDLGTDITVCEGEEAFIESPFGEAFSWSTGSTAPNISVNTAGTYSLTVTDAFECTSSDSIIVEIVNDINLVIANDSLSICPGDSLQLLVSGAENYTWIEETVGLSSIDIANPVASPMESTLYSLVGTSSCGEDTLRVAVDVYEITATAGKDTCVASGTELQLNASGGALYYWIGGDYPLNNYNVPNPKTVPEDSTTYSIMIIDANNCTTFDEVIVQVGARPSLFIPKINLITPNGDGQNDALYFGNISKYGPNTLKIFNRWGDLVYDRVNYQSGEERFDGHYNDKPLPAGTYYYILSFREEDIKQTLTIVRE